MHVLVLGGTRFVGPHVVRQLTDAGHKVTLFHRRPTDDAILSRAAHVYGDLNQYEEHVPRLRALNADVVLDMIPFRQEHGRRVRYLAGSVDRGIVISSVDVYRAFGRLHHSEPGVPEPVPLTELSALRALPVEPSGMDPLNYHKTGVELEARGDVDFPVTILRLPGTHGPGDYYNRLYDYVRRMDDNRPAIFLEDGLASWVWSRGYVRNVAHAVALACSDSRAIGRTYNVADPVCVTEAEWVRKIASVHGWQGQVVVVPTSDTPPQLIVKWNTAQDYDVSSERIRDELGFTEVVQEQVALETTIRWERTSPPKDAARRSPDYAVEDALAARML